MGACAGQNGFKMRAQTVPLLLLAATNPICVFPSLYSRTERCGGAGVCFGLIRSEVQQIYNFRFFCYM